MADVWSSNFYLRLTEEGLAQLQSDDWMAYAANATRSESEAARMERFTIHTGSRGSAIRPANRLQTLTDVNDELEGGGEESPQSASSGDRRVVVSSLGVDTPQVAMVDAMCVFLSERVHAHGPEEVYTIADFWNHFFQRKPEYQAHKPSVTASAFLAEHCEVFSLRDLDHGQSAISLTNDGRVRAGEEPESLDVVVDAVAAREPEPEPEPDPTRMLDAMCVFLSERVTTHGPEEVYTLAEFWSQFFVAKPEYEEHKPTSKASAFLADHDELFSLRDLDHGQSAISLTYDGRLRASEEPESPNAMDAMAAAARAPEREAMLELESGSGSESASESCSGSDSLAFYLKACLTTIMST
jgi:hypothetical protein